MSRAGCCRKGSRNLCGGEVCRRGVEGVEIVSAAAVVVVVAVVVSRSKLCRRVLVVVCSFAHCSGNSWGRMGLGMLSQSLQASCVCGSGSTRGGLLQEGPREREG